MFIDGHADTISKILREKEGLYSNNAHFDIKRAIAAGIEMQVLALFTPEKKSSDAAVSIKRQIDYFNQQLTLCKDKAFDLTESTQLNDLGEQRIGLMLHLEGGDAIGHELSMISNLYERGVRSVGLTWNYGNAIASGIMDVGPQHGLTDFGREVIKELNRMRMIVDVAHASHKTFYDVLELTESPPWVSHANVYSLCQHPRNLTDDQIKAVKDANGVVGICFVPDFVGSDADINSLVDHICYISNLIGIEHVAFGSDFDGTPITVVPDVSKIPELIGILEKRQFNADEIKNISGGNLLRLLKQVL
ncbi:MAG: dipeptidase [Acidobacteriota bacterium]